MHRKSSPQGIKETNQLQDPPTDAMYMHASIASAIASHLQVLPQPQERIQNKFLWVSPNSEICVIVDRNGMRGAMIVSAATFRKARFAFFSH